MLDRERPDFVDIITPPETHEEMCAFAAARGIHIICQKPLAPTYDASKRIVDDSAAANVRFMVHENFRWQPWYRAIKDVQARGDIGDFTHIHFLMRMGDGWGEDAYLARQPFFREYPRLLILRDRRPLHRHLPVPARRGGHGGRRDEAAQPGDPRRRRGTVAVEVSQRVDGDLGCQPLQRIGGRDRRGSRSENCASTALAAILTMDANSTIRVKRLGQPAAELDYARERKNFAGDCVFFLQRHFVDCMLSGHEFESRGHDYLKNVRIVDAAYESARTGSIVRVT